jgi:heme/copper-type cytochrome/quinol oxidase subunit 3
MTRWEVMTQKIQNSMPHTKEYFAQNTRKTQSDIMPMHEMHSNTANRTEKENIILADEGRERKEEMSFFTFSNFVVFGYMIVLYFSMNKSNICQ